MVLAALDINRDNGQLEALRDDFNKMLGRWQDGKFWVQSFRELKPMVPHIRGQQLVSFPRYILSVLFCCIVTK